MVSSEMGRENESTDNRSVPDITLNSLTQYARRGSGAGIVSNSGSKVSNSARTQSSNQTSVQNVESKEEKKEVAPLPAPKKKRKKKNFLTANLSGTRYDVIRQMAERRGFSVAKEDDPSCYLIWNDCFVSTDRISELKPFQRINHFPGMGEVTRKDCLARNMMKVVRVHQDEYNFVPKTWILPADHSMLINYAKDLKAKKKHRTFIVKPCNGAQGHGISLFRNAEKIPATDHFIVQEYIEKPFLLDSYKFDLRVYVLITSCDPLRVFLFKDGLVRLSTEKYQSPHDSNINHLFMHLTNYSVNKHNEFYEKGDSVDTGSKRSIQYLMKHLAANTDYSVSQLWRNIGDMVVKTLIVALPHLLHAYRMCRPGAPAGSDSVCFEVLGFDILLDRNLNPWLLEFQRLSGIVEVAVKIILLIHINRSPSFGTDEQIDWNVKSTLIDDTIRLLNVKISDKKRNIAAQKAETHKRLFRTTKRPEGGELSEFDKKRQSLEKRKEDLKDMLARLRKLAAREDFENRNSGHFHRIFPSDDRMKQDHYVNLMVSVFNIFMSGRAPAMQKEIQKIYSNKLREEDILDMIAECEADEKEGRYFSSGIRPPKGPKPLLSMPQASPPMYQEEEYEEQEEEETEGPSVPGTPNTSQRPGSPNTARPPSTTMPRADSRSSTYNSRPNSGVTSIRSRPQSNVSIAASQRSRSVSRLANGKQPMLQRSTVDDTFLLSVVREREDELTRKTLMALNEMRIKFPGKSDQEAETILDRLHENWKFHKPRIASYWLVKLDSIKRRKVVDIVRSNVRAVLQRTWRVGDVDNIRLYRIFSRVFGRLLWSHGQGLWNCFSSSSAGSWESIFSKSSDILNEVELGCCRRIVQLCKDCLLIVYQFAAEAKTTSTQNTSQQTPTSDNQGSSRDRLSSSSVIPNTQTMSQRYSKLYPQTIKSDTS